MLGTSAGIADVHNARALPFDTLTYILRADAEREKIPRSHGVFFAFDKRLHMNACEKQDVTIRTERLRTILSKVLPHFLFKTHTDLERDGLDETLAAVQANSAIEHEERRLYTRMQTAQVLHMHTMFCGSASSTFTKFGWILSRRASGVPVGGEAHFDAELPAIENFRTLYTSPAFSVNSTNGKAPYLLNTSDTDTRVCIPEHRKDIDAELKKIQTGIRRVTLETIRTTAAVLSGISGSSELLHTKLTKLPLSKPMKRTVEDPKEISSARDLVSTSFETLLS